MSLIQKIVTAAQAGAVILTANQRLSRTLRKVYDDQQRAEGRTAWESVQVLPLTSWLRARWSDAQLAGEMPVSALLSQSQEEILWRRIIAASPESERLLDLRGAAQSAMQAWRLVHQYRLPFDARWSAHEDWAAFKSWASAYCLEADAHRWLDEPRLTDAVRDAVKAAPTTAPKQTLLAGFDEFTPQQRDLFDALKRAGCIVDILEHEASECSIVRRGCRDADDELRNAAEWARDRLVQGDAACGIVLLNLGTKRSRLERIFDEVLHPERMGDPAGSGPRTFHISVPAAIGEYSAISSALLTLRMAAQRRWLLSDAGLLLRSVFLAGGISEAPARAVVDAKLRRRRRAYAPVTAVAAAAAESPLLLSMLEQWRLLAPDFSETRSTRAWLPTIRVVLQQAGWPGERVLSSPEYQVVEAWGELLHTFASLDRTCDSLSYSDAIALLAELARESNFQPQDPGAPVQILGALEAAGARFDAVWICGTTDQTWPAPAHPHPFIPLSLQQERQLPHSSPEREYEFALRTFERLQSSAPELVVSWAKRAGDVALRPSPLVEHIREHPTSESADVDRERIELEQIFDETGPALDTVQPRGGTRLVKAQAACPFQAFADLRLGARPLESGELGLSAADRGIEIHEALRLFWESVRDHATLVAMSDQALRRATDLAARGAVRKQLRDTSSEFDQRFRDLEVERLNKVLIDWAALEKTRAPFAVAFNECERVIEIGGLQLGARIDRLDELPDGSQVIVDYKVTAPSVVAWAGDRPDEPQVPLYAISNGAPVAALAFAQVGPDGLRFKGLSNDAAVLPGTKVFAPSAEEQITAWRRVVESLAQAFRSGEAAADPKNGHGTCDLCKMTSLCRIHESAPEDDDASA